MKKVLRRYPFEILCGNWSLPYTGWEKPKKQIFPSAPTEISQFQNMASIKTNKIKKRTPLHYINFWKLTTLLFCPKRLLHPKGPKNAICLWLRQRKIKPSWIWIVWFCSIFIVSQIMSLKIINRKDRIPCNFIFPSCFKTSFIFLCKVRRNLREILWKTDFKFQSFSKKKINSSVLCSI